MSSHTEQIFFIDDQSSSSIYFTGVEMFAIGWKGDNIDLTSINFCTKA